MEENRYFVFHHSLMAVSDFHYYSLDEIFHGRTVKPVFHEAIGNISLFKIDRDQDGLNIGYMLLDPDIDITTIPSNMAMRKINFPKAEYHFILHDTSFKEIDKTYKKIQEELEEEKLDAIIHPILVFPKGLPPTIDHQTIIEVWTASNADFQANYRRSELIDEALPRKSFNFYTW